MKTSKKRFDDQIPSQATETARTYTQEIILNEYVYFWFVTF